MASGTALFNGDSDIDQLRKIFELVFFSNKHLPFENQFKNAPTIVFAIILEYLALRVKMFGQVSRIYQTSVDFIQMSVNHAFTRSV